MSHTKCEIHGAQVDTCKLCTRQAERDACCVEIAKIMDAHGRSSLGHRIIDRLQLGLHLGEDLKRNVTAREIQQVVATDYGVSVDQIKSKVRYPNITVPRYVAIYLTREMTAMSLKQIGRQFGDRDHTTIIHACRRAVETAKPERLALLRAAILAEVA